MINSSKDSLNDQLIVHLKNCFEGNPWYGRSILYLLDKYHPLSPQSKSILAHITVWRTFVNRALNNDIQVIELNSPQDWPSENQSEKELIKNLKKSQTDLVRSIATFKPSLWNHKIEGAKYTYFDLVQGVIDHDLYHLGQIVIIEKRLLKDLS